MREFGLVSTSPEGDDVFQRDTYVYEAVQRVYRAWFVGHCRERLRATYADDAVGHLRRVFGPDFWTEVEEASARARSAGAVSSRASDEFDLVDVAHIANIVEAEFDVLFPGPSSEPKGNRSSRRDQILRWVRTVKSVRDPISHPVEQEISLEDARATIDSARRVVGAVGGIAVERLSELYEFVGAPANEPLECDLPPSEMIGSFFVGRQSQLADLSNWLAKPDARRWVLAGAGGRGKTAIAYEFARRVRDIAPRHLTFVLWLSAKKSRYVEGEVAEVPYADFSDLPSALSRILAAFGWAGDTPADPQAQIAQCIRLLDQFPTLLIADDIDSLEGEDEGVSEFLTEVAYKTKSKVLLTSRRSLHGLGGSTTMVPGLSMADFDAFLDERIERMGLDHAVFRAERRTKIYEVTDGTPLFVEDLLRLVTIEPIDRAVSLWREKGGDAAREYALGRELEMLSRSATEVLIAASARSGAVSKTELEFVTRRTGPEVDGAMKELQRLFLLPLPRLIKDEERYQLDYNTRALVRRVAAANYGDTLARIRAAYQAVSGEADPAPITTTSGGLREQCDLAGTRHSVRLLQLRQWHPDDGARRLAPSTARLFGALAGRGRVLELPTSTTRGAIGPPSGTCATPIGSSPTCWPTWTHPCASGSRSCWRMPTVPLAPSPAPCPDRWCTVTSPTSTWSATRGWMAGPSLPG